MFLEYVIDLMYYRFTYFQHIESFLEDPISKNAELIKVLKTLENKS